MKQEVLQLNKSFLPCGITTWKGAMTQIVSGSAFPVDVVYELDSEGLPVKNKFEYFEVVKDFQVWKTLPVRISDDSVNTPSGRYRIPPFVVCARYNSIAYKKVVFPTKSNIWDRDNWTCQYSGKKLTREEVSVDHIIPVSRGGQNTWENLVTCDKALNIWKSDRTPRECGLKLLRKPTHPKNGKIFNYMRDEWLMFLENGEFQTT